MMKNNENDPPRQIMGPDGKMVILPPGKDPIAYTSELAMNMFKQNPIKHVPSPTPPPPEKVSPVETPSLFQMIRGFTKDLTKYISEGAPNVSAEDYGDRLDACNSCPHLLKDSMKCGICGCLIENKAKWQTTTCPDTPPRWAPQKNCNCNDKRQESNNPETRN